MWHHSTDVYRYRIFQVFPGTLPSLQIKSLLLLFISSVIHANKACYSNKVLHMCLELYSACMSNRRRWIGYLSTSHQTSHHIPPNCTVLAVCHPLTAMKHQPQDTDSVLTWPTSPWRVNHLQHEPERRMRPKAPYRGGEEVKTQPIYKLNKLTKDADVLLTSKFSTRQ